MLRPEIEAVELIKEFFDLHVFGKPDVLLDGEDRLCIRWNDDTGRSACGPYQELVELAKASDGSLERFWEKLQAANFDTPK